MYELTASEGVTLLSILAREGEGPSVDPHGPGVPESTFYATRRKIYKAGWVTDRFVPNPWATGFSALDCILTSPPAPERDRVEKEWATSPENVLLWSGPNVLFGVFFRRDGMATPVEEGMRVSVTPTSGSIPVYFDYSRLWSRFIGVETMTRYPRAVGGAAIHTERCRTLAFPALLHSDGQAGSAFASAHPWHSLTSLPKNQRLLLEWGLVQSRTFLNVDALPPYEGRLLGEVVFVRGRMRSRVSASNVLSELNQRCSVNPFLLVEDGTSLLLIALGQIAAGEPKRRRVHTADAPVLATLGSLLEDLRVSVERTDSMQYTVNHRYDRLFPLVP